MIGHGGAGGTALGGGRGASPEGETGLAGGEASQAIEVEVAPSTGMSAAPPPPPCSPCWTASAQRRQRGRAAAPCQPPAAPPAPTQGWGRQRGHSGQQDSSSQPKPMGRSQRAGRGPMHQSSSQGTKQPPGPGPGPPPGPDPRRRQPQSGAQPAEAAAADSRGPPQYADN
jgi:hypothetical protein